ncbi:hypothetical protein [Mycolicibacterium peregrinum]|uniref:hypothetical protein n=1 Tax=Mycolicibacterium peregrinum TaxID=43304 RepID=UPI003AAD1BFD
MTARLALASLFIVAAVLARPWQTNTERWVLGVSVAAVVLLLAWWGGLFLTTRIARHTAVLRRNLAKSRLTNRARRPSRCGSIPRTRPSCRWWSATWTATAFAATRSGSPTVTPVAPAAAGSA